MKKVLSIALFSIASAYLFGVLAYWMVNFFALWYEPKFVKNDTDLGRAYIASLVFLLFSIIIGAVIGYKGYNAVCNELMTPVSSTRKKYFSAIFCLVGSITFFVAMSYFIYLMRPWYYTRFPTDADTDGAAFVAVVWCIKLFFSLLGAAFGYKLYCHTEQTRKINS